MEYGVYVLTSSRPISKAVLCLVMRVVEQIARYGRISVTINHWSWATRTMIARQQKPGPARGWPHFSRCCACSDRPSLSARSTAWPCDLVCVIVAGPSSRSGGDIGTINYRCDGFLTSCDSSSITSWRREKFIFMVANEENFIFARLLT